MQKPSYKKWAFGFPTNLKLWKHYLRRHHLPSVSCNLQLSLLCTPTGHYMRPWTYQCGSNNIEESIVTFVNRVVTRSPLPLNVTSPSHLVIGSMLSLIEYYCFGMRVFKTLNKHPCVESVTYRRCFVFTCFFNSYCFFFRLSQLNIYNAFTSSCNTVRI